MKPLLFDFFNDCILTLSSNCKVNASKELKNYRFTQTNVADFFFFFFFFKSFCELIPLNKFKVGFPSSKRPFKNDEKYFFFNVESSFRP